jgi:hypothetical protein
LEWVLVRVRVLAADGLSERDRAAVGDQPAAPWPGWLRANSRPAIGERGPAHASIRSSERRVYALVAGLPYSGAQTAFLSFDMTIESLLEGHVRAFEWLEGVPRECVYDNLRSVVAHREAGVIWNRRFLYLLGHYAFRRLRAHRRLPERERVGWRRRCAT